jgi:hypothetical protein
MKTSVRTRIHIDRPPEAVEEVILDASKAILWTTDLDRIEVISGAPGEVGSVAHLHYLQGGRTYVMVDELLEVEPGRRYLSRVTGEALSAEVETTLIPTGEGTELHLKWTGSGRSLPLRLLLPFMRAQIRKQAMTDLEKLKALVESRPDPST